MEQCVRYGDATEIQRIGGSPSFPLEVNLPKRDGLFSLKTGPFLGELKRLLGELKRLRK